MKTKYLKIILLISLVLFFITLVSFKLDDCQNCKCGEDKCEKFVKYYFNECLITEEEKLMNERISLMYNNDNDKQLKLSN